MNRRAVATAVRYRGAREATGRAARNRGKAESAGTGSGNRKGPGNSNVRMESLGSREPGNKGSRRSSGGAGFQELGYR